MVGNALWAGIYMRQNTIVANFKPELNYKWIFKNVCIKTAVRDNKYVIVKTQKTDFP
jgi:hypothetical protein